MSATPRAALVPGLGTWPARRARAAAHRPALVGPGRTLTYGELAARVDRLAADLRARGVGAGDRVAQVGVNAVSVLETFFAVWRLGAIVVPLNHRLAPAEIAYMLADSGAALLVAGEDAAALVAAAAPPCPVTWTDAGFEDVATNGPTLDDAPDVGPENPAILLYTSGTTGRPKAAVLSHGNLTWNTVNQLADTDVASTDRALCIAPLFHCVGLGQITLPTLLKGGSVEPLPRFDPGAVLARIGEAGITSFSAVPTMLQMMVEDPGWEAAELGTLHTVLYGGSPVQERVARAWLERGVRLQQGYGMTEASPGVCMVPREGDPGRPVSVGVPHFFTDTAMLRDGVRDGLPGEPAELLVRGPHVFGGYWERPAESAAAFVDGDWFRTGDVLRVDDDGWADVVDRVKDVIISGGENIYPAEVEAVLVARDEVADAAVVGVPDERWGEVGAAYVQLRPGRALDEDALRAHLEAHLARYKIPKYLVAVDALPRNATGKIRRVELRGRAVPAAGGVR
ncbi:acyl-CoA synthetase [Actinomycetospora lemnae]|uniref:Long-chain fatty acid--CoA ligase n=1 Tax=Actinomycetospora lemnae TaxID=3019891 RepID=A0ABT5SPK7_9PSEU|nr:long-chain fatty acid--CoA ligase [Actinomycetospora sp. DW7H6]MDD7964785.1 long-chain fatty acid--CoA ligase [Actinomycetospora sp. DW7H6]